MSGFGYASAQTNREYSREELLAMWMFEAVRESPDRATGRGTAARTGEEEETEEEGEYEGAELSDVRREREAKANV